jgi:hypothetical protein
VVLDRPVPEQVEAMRDLTENDLAEFAKKAAEYGSADLEVMGSAMAELHGLTPEQGVEAAIAFYILGKVSRAFGAFKMGKMPSDDTWHDVSVYTWMIRERRTRGFTE